MYSNPTPTVIAGVFSVAVIATVLLLCTPTKGKAYDAPTQQAPIDINRMIDTLHKIENWDRVTPGQHGEVGDMQFKKLTWHQFSNKPFSYAWGRTPWQRKEVARVEADYVLWLIKVCTQKGAPATPFWVAYAHNRGIGNMQKEDKARSKFSLDFATRAETIYYAEDEK